MEYGNVDQAGAGAGLTGMQVYGQTGTGVGLTWVLVYGLKTYRAGNMGHACCPASYV